MNNMINTVFAATGSYIPEVRVSNEDFLQHHFFDSDGKAITRDNAVIVGKFKDISGIEERRYARPEQTASELGFLAAEDALESSGIDRESLDYIIVAHNFGDIADGSNRVSIVPSLASRIKSRLQIRNPDCVAYDIAFGCPGWVEALIQASYYIRSGDAQRCLVIGAETLSRITDPHDRDSMLYADGSGAAIVTASTSGSQGILAHKTQTHACDYAMLLNTGRSYAAGNCSSRDIFIKMNGRKLYEFALNHVPLVIKAALDKAGVPVTSINKVLIHQANLKMDKAILDRLFKLYGLDTPPPGLMPMTIARLGNSSVATIPTLLDLIQKGKLDGHSINTGDKVVLASVGAGMSINAVVYQF